MTLNKNNLFAWTDYPIDDDHSTKQVQVLRYDRDKYASVQFGEKYESIKVGYLYRDCELRRRFSQIDLYMLPTYDGDRSHSRKEAIDALKNEKRRKTTYDLWIGSDRIEFFSLSDALKKLSKNLLKADCNLTRNVRCNYGFRSEPLIESDNGSFTLYSDSKERCILKIRHLKIMDRFKHG